MHNIQIEQYGFGVLRVLSDIDAAIIERQNFDFVRRNSVLLTASIRYRDGSRIRIRMIINTDSDYPDWYSYSFHYMTVRGDTVFRYDNARHYPEMHTFPHHKHEGADERAIASHQPSVRRIRNEIVAHLLTN